MSRSFFKALEWRPWRKMDSSGRITIMDKSVACLVGIMACSVTAGASQFRSAALEEASSLAPAVNVSVQEPDSSVRKQVQNDVTGALSAGDLVMGTPDGTQLNGTGNAGGFTEGPCPRDVVIGLTACFFDTAGKLHHWVHPYDVETFTTNFWGTVKRKVEHQFVVEFAAVRDRQLAYDEWIKAQDPKDAMFNYQPGYYLHGTRVCVAYSKKQCAAAVDWIAWIKPDGRLTLHTLVIPYYKSAPDFEKAQDRFDAARKDPAIAAPVLEAWRAALADVIEARRSFKKFADDYIGQGESSPLNCRGDGVVYSFPLHEGMNCAFDVAAIPPGTLERVSVLSVSLERSMQKLRALETSFGVR